MSADHSLARYLHDISRALRICVTGGRDYDDAELVAGALGRLNGAYVIVRLAHGDAPGADRLAATWARDARIQEVVAYPADWNRFGRRAGPTRNRRMLEAEQPDLLVAFPGGRGTADCIQAARTLGVRVWKVAHG